MKYRNEGVISKKMNTYFQNYDQNYIEKKKILENVFIVVYNYEETQTLHNFQA